MRVLPESLFSKFLQCQLCQDNFKDPKLLPCRHTFCHRCLERHLLRSTTTTASLWFLCPSCRSITDVPKDGIASFKSNYFVVNLSSALEHCQKRVGCSAGAGAKFVERSGVTVNTSTGAGVVASNVAVSNGAASNAQSKVSKDKINDESELCRCGKNALRFYCDQCAVVACGDCFQDQHVDHSFLLLEERANKDRDTILSVINEGRNGVNRIEEGLQDLARYKRNLRHTRDDVAAKIKKQASLLHDLITVLEEKQLKDVDDVYNKETEKASMIQKYNTDVATMLRTLNDFADNLLKEGTDSHVVLWKNTISKQQQTVSQDAKLKAVSFLKDNPLDMSYKIDAVDLEVVLKQVIGEVQFGKSIDLFDEGLGMTLSKNPTEFISDGDNGNVRVLTNRVHEASLVKSFSAFTDGSQYSPMIVDVAMTSNNDVIVVDKNNKTVKIFAADGGMFCKMYGSECVFGVCMLDGDTIAVTDNTVHMFDMKGRLVKVLRQQPRDSHGIARLGSGQIVVTDCSSRYLNLNYKTILLLIISALKTTPKSNPLPTLNVKF